MRKYFYILILSVLLVTVSCNNEQDPYQISKQHVGLLTDSTQVKDLKAIYTNDSIARYISGDEFTGDINNIEIFDKSGKKLLVLTPSEALDSTAVIKTVRVLDERFKTEKNISTISTFQDIKDNYKISKINNLIRSILISVNEINATFTIDKKELPSNLQFDLNLDIEASQIPDNAKIKYFMINWN